MNRGVAEPQLPLVLFRDDTDDVAFRELSGPQQQLADMRIACGDIAETPRVVRYFVFDDCHLCFSPMFRRPSGSQ
jgi:hypothetical protein